MDLEEDTPIDELDKLIEALEKASKVTVQRQACDQIKEWLGKHWDILLDAKTELPSNGHHPADELLIACINLFKKCKDARTPAQQELPITMTKYLIFGVNPGKNITLLTFGNLEYLLAHLKAMMDNEQKRLEGASLLLEVLEVPAYRELVDLDWLVHLAHLCLNMTSTLIASRSSDKHEDKKQASSLLGIVQIVLRELCRDSGTNRRSETEELYQLSKNDIGRFVECFSKISVLVQNQRCEDRTLVRNYMRALNEFHATYVLDYREFAVKLRESTFEVIRDFWGAVGMDALKKSFVQYLRLLIRAQLIVDAAQLSPMIELFRKDVAAGTKGTEEKRGVLTYDEAIKIELFVDLMHLRARICCTRDLHQSDELESDSSDESRPAKRQRVASDSADLDWLVSQERMFPERKTGIHPRWYMQILFFYLIKHPDDIDVAMRTSLLNHFKRTFQNSVFEDLDLIWAMRCLDELLVANQLHLDGEQPLWEEIFSCVLNISSGRRGKKLEAFEAVALNLLASIVSEGAVSARYIEQEKNMNVLWKFLVTIWGHDIESQAVGKISSSLHAKQAKEGAGRPVQDSVQVDEALTAFLVAVLNRVSLSYANISVEGVQCSRQSLLSILLRKVEERRLNAVGHSTQLKLLAILLTATIGSGRGAQSCTAQCLRDTVSESRRSGIDVFRNVGGESLYSQIRGRGGPDFSFLGDSTRQEFWGAHYSKIVREGTPENCKFERSLANIGKVTGWYDQTMKILESNDASSKWAVHLQIPQEEVSKLSEILFNVLRQYVVQDNSCSFSPQLYLVVCLFDSALAERAPDRKWMTEIYDYLFKYDALSDSIQKILLRCNDESNLQKVAIFQSLEDVVDILVRVHTRKSEPDLRKLGVNFEKVKLKDVLDNLRKHCEEEIIRGSSEKEHGRGMEVDDRFDVEVQHSDEQMKADKTYRRMLFRMWVKASASTEPTQGLNENVLKRIFEACCSIEETLEKLNVLCNFAVPESGVWEYSVDIIKLAAVNIKKYTTWVSPNISCDMGPSERQLRLLQVASFLVDVLGLPGVQMRLERKKELLNSIKENVLKWKADQNYEKTRLKKSLAKLPRMLRQMSVLCAGKVASLAVECDGRAPSMALGQCIIGSLNDVALEVRYQAAKSLGSAIRVCKDHVDLFKDVLEILGKLGSEMKYSVGDEANTRTRALVFGEVAALDYEHASVNMQAYCITQLCIIFEQNSDSRDFIRSVLHKIACCHGYSDPTELVRAHISSILCEWCCEDKAFWSKFPKELAGYNSEKLFVEECVGPTIVPEILLELEGSGRDKELTKIANIVGYRTPIDLVARCYAHVYSRVTPIAYAAANEATETGIIDGETAERYERAFGYLSNNCKDARRQTPALQIVLRLLDVILNGNFIRWDPHKKSTHWTTLQTADVIVTTLKNLSPSPELHLLGMKTSKKGAASQPQSASLSSAVPNGALEQCPTDFLPQIYLHLLRALKGHGRRKVIRQQKERVLETLNVVVKGLGEYLTVRIDHYPWVLNHTISQLLTAISDRDVARKGCEILKKVIDGVIEAEQSNFLVDVLGDIICMLIPQAVHCSTAAQERHDDASEENLPLLIIETLIEDVQNSESPEGLERIRGLPPFPNNLKVFDAVRDMITSINLPKGKSGVESQQGINVLLQVFEDLKEPVPLEVQKATLLHLHQQLREFLSSFSDSCTHSQHGRTQLKFDACIHKLLAWTKRASTFLQNDREEILDLIGKCLGQLGPTLKSALSLPTSMERTVAAFVPTNKADVVEEFLKSHRIQVCVAIIKKLRTYLQDDDVVVVEEAVRLLKGVFNLEERADLLDALNKDSNDENAQNGGLGKGNKRGSRAGTDRQSNNICKKYLEPFLNAAADIDIAPSFRRNKTALPASRVQQKSWSTKDEADRPRTYEKWLNHLSQSMCKADRNFKLWPLCTQMCMLKVDFAELIFPSLLLSSFLSSFDDENSEVVAAEVGNILASCIFCEDHDNLKAIRLVLQGLDVLRLVKQTIIKHYLTSKNAKSKEEDKVNSGTALTLNIKNWKYSYFFHVPYIDVARAARRCGAHLSALMYLEVHCEVCRSAALTSQEEVTKAEQVRKELLLAYRAVEEPDGLDAFNKLNDFRSRFIFWDHHGECAKTVGVFDNLLDVRASSSGGAEFMDGAMDLCLQKPVPEGMCAALHSMGNPQLSYMAASSMRRKSSTPHMLCEEEVFFESAWRAQAWGQTNAPEAGQRSAYHPNIFSALKALASVQLERSQTYGEVTDLVRHNVSLARSTALFNFQDLHDSQSTKYCQLQLVRLQICEDIELLLHELVKSNRPAATGMSSPPTPSPSQSRGAFARAGRADSDAKSHISALQRMLRIWHSRYKEYDYNFTLCEPLISLHSILLGISPCSSLLDEHLCMAAKLSMKSGNMSFARGSMHKLQMLASSRRALDEPSSWWIREAKVLWREEQIDKAADLMDELNRHLQKGKDLSQEDQYLQSRALGMNAALSHSTESAVTVKTMLADCVELRERLLKGANQTALNRYRTAAAKAHFKLAAFNDQMFSHIQSKQLEIKEHQTLLHSVTQNGITPTNRANALHKRVVKEVQQHVLLEQKQRAVYLKAALEHYMQCIAHDAGEGKSHGAIFRVLHLWFEILEDSDEADDQKLRDEVSEILRRRFDETDDLSAFTSVARQVLSRLNDRKQEEKAQQPIRVLLAKLLKQRPQDLLLPTFNISTLTGKTASAKNLIQELREDKKFENLVSQTEKLKDAYIELAGICWGKVLNKDPRTLRQGEKADLEKFSASDGRKSRLVQYSQREEALVRVPTVATSADPGNDHIYVKSFGKSVEYPGGVTKPKKIQCMASNGRIYWQIVKSDDPRGDAVLSQIFSLVNVHLSRDTRCRQRQLEVGTYTVVALGNNSCVIEFVEDAASLSSILGTSSTKDGFAKSLHGRFKLPDEWEYSTCVTAIREGYARAEGKTQEAQLERYQTVCSHVSPVFRHYFAESSQSAREWFDLRLKYTRSVAASSMAGHIVGLGDRHCSNILIRESGPQRGSLVHIDLGIIFDNGRHLPRPEQIPFRLTRDIIDGMGLAGTDGVMSRCAQESLRVMRENKYALLAIADVLLHDPLENWKMSVEKTKQKAAEVESGNRGSTQGSVSNDARIIRKTLKDKLEGWVRGELLGVQGQVKQLIHEAKSPQNLSLLFEGWGAWY